MDRGALWATVHAIAKVRRDWLTSTTVFSVCHGFLHPYRRIQYWGQTIQGGLETVGFMGTILFFPYPFFFIVKMKPKFFFFKTMQLLKALGKDNLG